MCLLSSYVAIPGESQEGLGHQGTLGKLNPVKEKRLYFLDWLLK